MSRKRAARPARHFMDRFHSSSGRGTMTGDIADGSLPAEARKRGSAGVMQGELHQLRPCGVASDATHRHRRVKISNPPQGTLHPTGECRPPGRGPESH